MEQTITVIPDKCHLWIANPVTIPMMRALELIETYVQESHFSRKLFRCPQCGQFYYREFYEEVMYDGDDLQYLTFIPIIPSLATINKLNEASIFEIAGIMPQLRYDYGMDKIEKIFWAGKPTMNNKNIVAAAEALATKYHQGQKRKGDGKPYITHPQAVAKILKNNGFNEETIAAGFCHDLLEDTNCTEQEIEDTCTRTVLETVKSVTHNDELSWEEKKIDYIERVRRGSDAAKAVCAADKIHNLQSLLKAYETQGPKLWQKFNRGKKEKLWFEQKVLKMLQETWDHPLLAEYEKLIAKMAELEE